MVRIFVLEAPSHGGACISKELCVVIPVFCFIKKMQDNHKKSCNSTSQKGTIINTLRSE